MHSVERQVSLLLRTLTKLVSNQTDTPVASFAACAEVAHVRFALTTKTSRNTYTVHLAYNRFVWLMCMDSASDHDIIHTSSFFSGSSMLAPSEGHSLQQVWSCQTCIVTSAHCNQSQSVSCFIDDGYTTGRRIKSRSVMLLYCTLGDRLPVPHHASELLFAICKVGCSHCKHQSA